MKLYALHGFLGLPSDFSFIEAKRIAINPAPSMEAWAEAFNRSIIKEDLKEKKVLIGYSMGGRLALHAWANRPDLWDQLILISTHPGLHKEEEKQKRIEKDEEWARRFEGEDWNAVLKDWNNQDTLKRYPLIRLENDYKREALASFLRQFSLGRQNVMEPPAIWLV
ncbi:MAG: alpha/beta fold hydrolase, partial [Parachlamydiaceae bacterium]